MPITLRKQTKPIKVGNTTIGGKNSVVIQSMTNTKTKDIEKTLKQIKLLASFGCQIVRVAVLDFEDAKALKKITEMSEIPIIADIHFSAELALEAIKNGVSKIRINPGNIGSDDKVKLVVEACKKKNIPIRIGVNSGSLPKNIKEKFGLCAKGLVEAAKIHVDILEKLNFKDIIISLKSTDPALVEETYTLASQTFAYPLHVGITESGSLIRGTVKSTYALTNVLSKGIGDTIRVSLSCDPEHEVIVGKEILANLGLNSKDYPNLISCPTCGRIQWDMFSVIKEIESYVNTLEGKVKIAIMGCVVNGPGEAEDADITCVGAPNKVIIYVKGVIKKIAPEKDAVKELKIIINEYLNLK